MGEKLQTNLEVLLDQLEDFLTTKTVVGEPIHIENTILVPLVDVSFGVGAGAYAKETKENNAGGGMGGKITPSAILVITNGEAKLVNVKNQDSLNKIIDMVPDIMDKLGKGKKEDKAGKVDDVDVDDVNVNVDL